MRPIFELFWSFFKIGAFTFGSGYAMIPLIEREVVERKKWFRKDEFLNHFTLASSAPGPFALNTAVFVGYKVAGWWGALVAVLGTVIPSFVILLLIAMYLSGFRDNEIVNAAFIGIRPAIIALIAVPFINFMKGFNLWQIAAAIVVAVVIWQFGVSPIYFIIAGSITGLIYTFCKKP